MALIILLRITLSISNPLKDLAEKQRYLLTSWYFYILYIIFHFLPLPSPPLLCFLLCVHMVEKWRSLDSSRDYSGEHAICISHKCFLCSYIDPMFLLKEDWLKVLRRHPSICLCPAFQEVNLFYLLYTKSPWQWMEQVLPHLLMFAWTSTSGIEVSYVFLIILTPQQEYQACTI